MELVANPDLLSSVNALERKDCILCILWNIAKSLQVLRLTLQDGLISNMQQVFMDDGRLLSGSSVAVHKDGQMMVGSIVGKALLCQIRHL